MLLRIKHAKRRVRIALVGKYVQLHDAYLSVAEALRHGGYENGVDVDIQWVDAEQVTPETAGELLGGAGGILVPGGFGDRGIEGKIAAAQYARERNVPYPVSYTHLDVYKRQIRNSADIIKAVALGADAVYIGTSALLALGCHLCRSCHSGKCNWGIATQRPDLRCV